MVDVSTVSREALELWRGKILEGGKLGLLSNYITHY